MVTDETCIVRQKTRAVLMSLLQQLSVLFVRVSACAVFPMNRIAAGCCMCCHKPVDLMLREGSVEQFSRKRKSMQLTNFKNGGRTTEDISLSSSKKKKYSVASPTFKANIKLTLQPSGWADRCRGRVQHWIVSMGRRRVQTGKSVLRKRLRTAVP